MEDAILQEIAILSTCHGDSILLKGGHARGYPLRYSLFWLACMLFAAEENNLHIVQSRASKLKQVPRTNILEEITKISLEIPLDIEENKPDKSILNIFGVAGIGKTFLVSQIFDYCIEQQYPCIWLDFDTVRPSPFGIPEGNLHEAIEYLHQIPALKFLPDTIIPAKGQPLSAESLSIRWLAHQPRSTQLKPLVLILDHLDDLSFWRWIQEEIIKPLIDQHPSLVICTSHSPLFWHFWELRERCRTLQLEQFSYQDTLEFLRLFERELLAPSAYALTQGYPLKLGHLMRAIGVNDQVITTIAQTTDVESMLSALTPITRLVLEYTGLLRRVEVDVMQAILDEVAPGWNDDASPHKIFLSQVLPELTAQQCFEPYRRRQPLRLLAALRYALTNRLRSTDPECFNRVCQLLERVYQERFLAKPIEDSQALNEWLYFSAVCRTSVEDLSEWKERVASLFSHGQVAGRRLVVQIYKDSELISRLDALGFFQTLQELIRTHFSTDESAPAILNTTELEQYRRNLIDQLSDQPPLTEISKNIPGGLLSLLRTILILDPQFDLPTLHNLYTERYNIEIKLGVVSQAVAILHSCGLVEYSREDRKYQLTKQALSLVMDIQPPAASSGTQLKESHAA